MENDKYRVKLNSSLEFGDGEHEVYEFVSDLAQKRKLTSTIMTLMRVYANNPDIFEPLMGETELQSTMECRSEILTRMEENQAIKDREYSAKLDLLATRLLALEGQLEMLHTLLEGRKFIGLTQRVEAVYCAEVLAKQKVKELGQVLGFTVTTERAKDLKQSTENTLAYMIEHYDGALDELREMVGAQPVPVQYIPAPVESRIAVTREEPVNKEVEIVRAPEQAVVEESTVYTGDAELSTTPTSYGDVVNLTQEQPSAEENLKMFESMFG